MGNNKKKPDIKKWVASVSALAAFIMAFVLNFGNICTLVGNHFFDKYPPNYGMAIRFYQMAASVNNAEAEYRLGHMYKYGIGVEADERESMKFFARAENQGVTSLNILPTPVPEGDAVTANTDTPGNTSNDTPSPTSQAAASNQTITGDDITQAFVDENFRSAVRVALGLSDSDPITKESCAHVSSLDVKGKSIKNLSGIEYFGALMYLDCSDNALESMDVSSNVHLHRLTADKNQLTQIDLAENTALENLTLARNMLKGITVSQMPNLTFLGLSNNQMEALDVSQNTKLVSLYCENNKITSLDLSKNLALEVLGCDGNGLTELDVSNNKKITYLTCKSNSIKTLDLSAQGEIGYLQYDDTCNVIRQGQTQEAESGVSDATESANAGSSAPTLTPYSTISSYGSSSCYEDYVPYGTVTITGTDGTAYTGVANSLALSSTHTFFKGLFDSFSSPPYSNNYTFENAISFLEIKSAEVNDYAISVINVNGGEMSINLPDSYSYSLVYIPEGSTDTANTIPLSGVSSLLFDWESTPDTNLSYCTVNLESASFKAPVAFVWFGVNQGSSIPSVVVTQDLRYKTEISLKTQDLSKITTMVDETIESNSLFTENTYMTVMTKSLQERTFLCDYYFTVYFMGLNGAIVRPVESEIVSVEF